MKKFSFFLSATLAASVVAHAQTDTITLTRQLDEVIINAPVAQVTNNHTELANEQLNQSNTGQNLPFLLSATPALVATSDDGLGVGYTYFRIRGTDHTRINMTLNDVPLNDSESQTVFWVNMTDMASSMSSLHIQRGVGTSTNGSASFGASINMQTGNGYKILSDVGEDKSRYELSFNGGMYNTFREMVNAHIVLPNQWRANARFSKVNSDGFLYRTASDLYSYYGDFGWYGAKTEVVARFFGGSEKTGMGWDGVDYNTAYGIDGADRRYNPAGEYTTTASDGSDSTVYYSNQTDNYAQQHAQLSINHQFTPQWSLSATAHYTHGAGYYEQYKRKKLSYWGLPYSHKAYGMYRKQLDNHFFGGVLAAKYISEPLDLQFGGAANYYMGEHFGTLHYLEDSLIFPINHEYYRNRGSKNDANIYLKADFKLLQGLNVYADMQYRHIGYKISGCNDKWNSAAGSLQRLDVDETFNFFNPKAGISWQIDSHNRVFASVGMAHKEPTRNNYTDGKLNERPKAERLVDYEFGYTFDKGCFHAGANIYYMSYKDQLVLTGELNEIGEPLAANIPRSYRAGIELVAGLKLPCGFSWSANAAFSRNRIKDFTEVLYDDNTYERWEIKHGSTRISFSPEIVVNNSLAYSFRGFEAELQSHYVGKQYMSNTGLESHRLDAYFVSDLRLAYTFKLRGIKNITVGATIYNIFDEEYESNGYAGSGYYTEADGTRVRYDYAGYAAQAGINILGHLNVEF